MIFAIFLLLAQEAVENGLNPSNPMSLTIARELTLGQDENDENQLFTMGVRLSVDEKGNMYVLDPGNFRVVVFDKNGAFVRKFGKQGQGPGEFQQPNEIRVTLDGRIAVFDTGSKKMSLFNREGVLEGEKTFSRGIQAIIGPSFLKSGNIAFTSVQVNSQAQTYYDFSLYDADLKPVKSFMHIDLPKNDWSKAGQPNFWADFLKNNFEAMSSGFPINTTIDNEWFVYARTNLYQGEIYDGDGALKARFSKKLKPNIFTDEAKEATFETIWQLMANNPMLGRNMSRQVFDRALETADLPDTLMPLWGAVSIGDKFAFLVNYDAAKRKGRLELFDRDGRCVGGVDYEGANQYLLGAGDRLYTVGPNEDDNLIIVRHRIGGL